MLQMYALSYWKRYNSCQHTNECRLIKRRCVMWAMLDYNRHVFRALTDLALLCAQGNPKTRGLYLGMLCTGAFMGACDAACRNCWQHCCDTPCSHQAFSTFATVCNGNQIESKSSMWKHDIYMHLYASCCRAITSRSVCVSSLCTTAIVLGRSRNTLSKCRTRSATGGLNTRSSPLLLNNNVMSTHGCLAPLSVGIEAVLVLLRDCCSWATGMPVLTSMNGSGCAPAGPVCQDSTGCGCPDCRLVTDEIVEGRLCRDLASWDWSSPEVPLRSPRS